MNRSVVILGSGGHAKVLSEILQRLSIPILGYTDLSSHVSRLPSSIPYLGEDVQISKYDVDDIALVNGIGAVGLPTVRKRVYDQFIRAGYHFMTIIHHQAIVSPSASIQQGVQIMASAVVQAGTIIGENAIVNTNATIDHDSVIGSHTHVAPGSTLCGEVKVGTSCFIGAGATVIQGVHIGNESVIGAGSVVLNSIGSGSIAYGIPAREVSQ